MAKRLNTTNVAELTVGEIEDLLVSTLTGAIKATHADCPIPCSARPHVPAVFTMIEDINGGDLKRGIEELRHNHEFTTGFRLILKSLANKLVLTLGGLFVIGVLGTLWYAAKHWVGKG